MFKLFGIVKSVSSSVRLHAEATCHVVALFQDILTSIAASGLVEDVQTGFIPAFCVCLVSRSTQALDVGDVDDCVVCTIRLIDSGDMLSRKSSSGRSNSINTLSTKSAVKLWLSPSASVLLKMILVAFTYSVAITRPLLPSTM